MKIHRLLLKWWWFKPIGRERAPKRSRYKSLTVLKKNWWARAIMNASWPIRVRASPWWLLLPKIPCVLAKFQMFGTRCVKRSMTFAMNCHKGYKAHFLMMNLATLLVIFMCWQAQTMTTPPSKNMPTVCNYNCSGSKMWPKSIWSVCKTKKSGLSCLIPKPHNSAFLLARFSKPYNNKTAWQAQVFLKPIQTVFRYVSAVRCTVLMS